MFALSDIQVHHKRNVYSMLDFLGDLGGIFGTVYFAGGLLHFFVAGKDMEQ